MTDINEMFSRDPLDLTNEDIDDIIEEMRKRRHLFKTVGAPKPGPTKLTEKQTLASRLDIGDFKL